MTLFQTLQGNHLVFTIHFLPALCSQTCFQSWHSFWWWHPVICTESISSASPPWRRYCLWVSLHGAPTGHYLKKERLFILYSNLNSLRYVPMGAPLCSASESHWTFVVERELEWWWIRPSLYTLVPQQESVLGTGMDLQTLLDKISDQKCMGVHTSWCGAPIDTYI